MFAFRTRNSREFTDVTMIKLLLNFYIQRRLDYYDMAWTPYHKITYYLKIEERWYFFFV